VLSAAPKPAQMEQRSAAAAVAAAKAAAAAQPGKTPGSDRVPSFEELQRDLDVQEAGDEAAERARAAGSSEEAVQQVRRHSAAPPAHDFENLSSYRRKTSIALGAVTEHCSASCGLVRHTACWWLRDTTPKPCACTVAGARRSRCGSAAAARGAGGHRQAAAARAG
jgi:hypothetical protein